MLESCAHLQWDAAGHPLCHPQLEESLAAAWVTCDDATVLGAWRGGKEWWDVRKGLPEQPPAPLRQPQESCWDWGCPAWDLCLGFATATLGTDPAAPGSPTRDVPLQQQLPGERASFWAAQKVNFRG